MRTISIISALVIFHLCISFPLAAQDGQSSYAFRLTPSIGFLWGQGEEIVFQEHPGNSNPYTSQLLWDFKPLIYLGFDLEFTPRNPWEKSGFHAGFSLKYGLPLKTGIVENSDWLSPTESFLTHYSEHDAFSRSSLEDLLSGYGTFILDLSIGYSWAVNKRLWLRAYGDLSYKRFSWMSWDGFYQYGPNFLPGLGNYIAWTPDFEKINYSGRAIAYSQSWTIISPGAAIGVNLSEHFSLSSYALISPIIFGKCKDEHFSRGDIFWDSLFGGLYFRLGAELNYAWNHKITYSLSTAWMNLKDARGDTTIYQQIGPAFFVPDNAGGGFSFWDISLSVKYTF